MFTASYQETMDEAGSAARAREREAFGMAIAALEAVRGVPPVDPARRDAVRRVQELWRILIADLASEANALPDHLRADLVSIGLWAIREADRLLSGETEDVGPLVEVLATIRDGLREGEDG